MPLKAEMRFIIYFVKTNPDMDYLKNAANLFMGDLDWDYIVEKSISHGVASILYQNLNNLNGVYTVPPEIKKRLQQIYYGNLFRNMVIYNEVENIIQAINTSNIKVIALKGVALGEMVYSNRALRPLGDIDLLIKKGDLSVIEKIMDSIGYYIPGHLLSKEFYLKNHFHLSLCKRTSPYTHLELHWELVDGYKQQLTNMQYIWANAISTDIAGQHAMVMNHEDQLIYICMHLNKHGYLNRIIIDRDNLSEIIFNPLSGNRLIWFIDILKIIERYYNNIDWNRVILNSKKWNVEGDVHAVLTIINRLFGQIVPDKIISGFIPYKPSFIELKIYGGLADNLERINISQGYLLKFFRSKILCMPAGLRYLEFRPIRIIDMLKDVFPSRNFIKKKYSISSCYRTIYCLMIHSFKGIFGVFKGSLSLLYYTTKKGILKG